MNRLILFFSLVVFTLSSYAQNWNDLFNQFQEITNNKQWDLALEKGEFLKKETEKKFTKNHANYSTVLSWIGYVYKNKNNFETAEKLYVEALDILNKVKPQDPSFFIFANQDLAYFYYDNKKFKEAIPFYEALLKILQKPDTNNSYWSYYVDLAQCYYNTSNTDLGITKYF